MTAGRRDQLITIQRATVVEDELGGEEKTWGTLAEEWVHVFWGAGSERRQAGQESASQSATFQALDNAATRSTQVTDRIVWNGEWDITGIAFPKRGEVEITAVRAL